MERRVAVGRGTWMATTTAAALALLLLAALPSPGSAQTVLAVGDSWADGAWDNLQEIFRRRGHREITVVNYAIPGTTAELWARNSSYLPRLVTLNPSTEWIWISLGGNDVFGYYSAYNGTAAMPAIETALIEILRALYAEHPQVKVVMAGYDFVNFEQSPACVAQALAVFHGLLTPDINLIFLDLGAVQGRVASSFPQVEYIPLWGTLQIAAGGTPTYLRPSPAKYFSDCIHLNNEGWNIFMGELYDQYWRPQLDP